MPSNQETPRWPKLRSSAARLKALEREGFVRWSGKSTKDPRAVWVLDE
jgi:ATP-dependent DNA helicase RecG